MSLPHPVTGALFASPVPPGTGWPGDPATPSTPMARDRAEVAASAAAATRLAKLDARVSVCRACPRLVAWREQVAEQKRAAFAGQPYWGRPAPGFGSAAPRLLVLGLAPAAHGANRTGRNFTGDRSGDFLYAALHRARLATQADSWASGDGLELIGVRITAAVHCAPPQNKPTAAEEATCAAWLDRELVLCSRALDAVLCLGQLAWRAFGGAARRLGWHVPTPLPRFAHGAAYEATVQVHGRAPTRSRTVRVAASYHVSQQNTFTGRLTADMLDDVLAGLLRPHS